MTYYLCLRCRNYRATDKENPVCRECDQTEKDKHIKGGTHILESAFPEWSNDGPDKLA